MDKAASDSFNGSSLTDPNDGSDPSTWAVGQDGTTAAVYVMALPAAELADVAAIFGPGWRATEEELSEKATFFGAMKRYLAIMRGCVGKTVDSARS